MRPFLLLSFALLASGFVQPAPADPIPSKASPSGFSTWFSRNALDRTRSGRRSFSIKGEEVVVSYLEQGNGAHGGGGGQSGRYNNKVLDMVLDFPGGPSGSMTGEDVLVHFDGLIDPEGALSTKEEIVIEHSAISESGAALAILFQANEGKVRGTASLTVSETRSGEAVLTLHTFEVHQTEANQ